MMEPKLCFISAGNEPSGHARMHIWRLLRGSNTPQLCCVASLMPRQLAAGYLTKESYFKEHASFIKMLDIGNTNKQSRRTHLCLMIEKDENNFYIPLRNNLGAEIRKFGRIGHAVPSEKRKNAGLDYRYALIINDESYIEVQTKKKIPESQYRRIKNDYEHIQKEFGVYVNGFVKAVKKKRQDKEPLYRESSLVNFLPELDLSCRGVTPHDQGNHR